MAQTIDVQAEEFHKATLLVLRPHKDSVRDRVTALLSRCGVDVTAVCIVPNSVENDEILSLLADARPRALLVPFHPQRDRQGRLVNGLQLAQRISSEAPHLLGIPMFMPVTPMGAATVNAAFTCTDTASSSALARRLILISIDALDSPATELAVRAGVERGRDTFPRSQR